jgi:hypothetical protein
VRCRVKGRKPAAALVTAATDADPERYLFKLALLAFTCDELPSSFSAFQVFLMAFNAPKSAVLSLLSVRLRANFCCSSLLGDIESLFSCRSADMVSRGEIRLPGSRGETSLHGSGCNSLLPTGASDEP